jgi:16S rRNA (cytosine967-C5)-methyltransferase
VSKSRTVSPARRCALDALRRVEEDGAFASAVLATCAAELQANDRALCHEIVLGCLRQQSWLDALLKHFAGRDPAKLDREVRRALRAGLYQLRFLTRIPASAVVNETVAHVRANGFTSAAGFANAVLRRAAREPDFDPTASISDELERLAVTTSHPAFCSNAGQVFSAEKRRKPSRGRTINHRRSPSASTLCTSAPRPRLPNSRRRARKSAFPRLSRTHGALKARRRSCANSKRRALIYIQSEASQLIAHTLDARAGERILDACAAPGSKTTHIAALTRNHALIVAADIHPHRLRLLLRLAARQHLDSVRAIVADAGADTLPFQPESFHRVLVDAPCTGTGTLAP